MPNRLNGSMPEGAAGEGTAAAGAAAEGAADSAGTGSVLMSVTVMAYSSKLVSWWMERALCGERQRVGLFRCKA